MNRLLNRIEELISEDQQLFVSTHSSFVLNRLGLSGLLLVSGGNISQIDGVSEDTVLYFQKLPGYDTLRMLLARRFVMVEGPMRVPIRRASLNRGIVNYPHARASTRIESQPNSVRTDPTRATR